MTISDPKTGEVIFESDQDIPEDKIPGIIDGVLKEKARESVISGYAPSTQDSARKASGRTNMWKKVMEEAKYNPMKDEKQDLGGKIKNLLLQNPTLALKLYGALAQTAESGISAPFVAAQQQGVALTPFGQVDRLTSGEAFKDKRFNAKEALGTIGRSLSGEAPTEFGDILRNEKLPERIAAAGGLAMSAMLPGIKGPSKQAGSAITKATTVANREMGKKGAQLARAQMELFARSEPEIAQKFFERNARMIKPGQSVASIQNEVHAAVGKADRAVRTVKSRATKLYDSGLEKFSDDVINVGSDDSLSKAFQKASKEYGIEPILEGEGIEQAIVGLRGNKRISGTQTLADVIYDLGAKPTHTVGSLRIKLKELDSLIQKTGEGAAEKSVRAQAIELSDVLRDAINSQSRGMGKLNKKYSYLTKYLRVDEAEKLPSVSKLLETGGEGGTKLDNYFKLKPEARAALREFDAQLPKNKRFLEELEDASINAAYKDILPRAKFSLMAPGAMLMGIGHNPIGLPVMAAGAAISSPRLSALYHKGMGDLVKGSVATRARIMSKPMGQAINSLTERGILGAGAVKGATRNAFMSPEEQQQQ